jgi:presenilin-like A22 family membrane protease
MKHTLKITTVLLAMFLITQLVGLAVIYADPLKVDAQIDGEIQEIHNPYLRWIDVPEPQTDKDFTNVFWQILIAFFIAVSLLLVLMKFKIELFLRIWFFAIVAIALFLSFVAIEKLVPWVIPFHTAMIIALVLALPLAFIKIFGRNLIVHNLTELLVYPGIAVIFIPILNFFTVILLLILISVYDMWAVWHSGVMQKMAKYQIRKLKVFSGFFVPYAPSKKVRKQIQMAKEAKKAGKKIKDKKIKVNVAILGGGDVIFPIITAGVMLRTFSQTPIGGLLAASLVILGATCGLGYLFFFAQKKKFYPAMPFITTGIFIGILLSWLIYTQILGFSLNLWPFF